MAAYLIVLREGSVRDQPAYDEYQRMNQENPTIGKLTPLVVYGALHGLEGVSPDGMVMIQFDSVEDARAWYESPTYQAALPHRLRCADWRAFIVEGM